MQHQIRKLDDHIINKIAAGEVVERPASVVKELVENSIDAGSSRIVVSIKDGGRKLIKVSDNGHGISADELENAVARHATSKIKDFDDLYRLKTNGFRGEALASICSVAKVTVSSQTKDGDASEIIVEGGAFIDQRACAQPQGTTVTVKYLFYQTPARLKFLKTAATETSHISDVMTKMALSHPEISFTLLDDERELMNVQAGQNSKERVMALLGRDLVDYLYDVQAETAGMKLTGLFSHPQVARSQRSQTFFFVNGRPVQDKVIWHAVMEAYRDLLMKGRYPVLVLHLWLDENTVDVNVHPAKSEVRFHQSQQVHHFIYQSLRTRLKEAPWISGLSETSYSSESIPNQASEQNDRFQSSFSRQDFVSQQKAQNDAQLSIKQSLNDWSNRFFSQGGEVPPVKTELSSFAENSAKREIRFGKTLYVDMNPIGQFLATYILCEADSRLILIDQHAAHERVGFEKLMLQYQQNGIKGQPLLIPETFDLKPSDTDILKNYLEELESFGFEIEFFGGNTFVIKSLPPLLESKVKIQNLIVDIVEDIKATGELVSLKDKVHHVLATMACHAQIRANHHLTLEEIKALLKELDDYQFTDFCPHGRPVSVEVTREEIEKWFKRVGA